MCDRVMHIMITPIALCNCSIIHPIKLSGVYIIGILIRTYDTCCFDGSKQHVSVIHIVENTTCWIYYIYRLKLPVGVSFYVISNVTLLQIFATLNVSIFYIGKPFCVYICIQFTLNYMWRLTVSSQNRQYVRRCQITKTKYANRGFENGVLFYQPYGQSQ